MKIDTKDPRELWKFFSEGQAYKDHINLYRTVDINERFYAGDQWFGLNAPDIDKPIINVIRQPINYMAATIVSDDIVIDLSPCLPSAEDERYLEAVKDEVERVLEQNDKETINRDAIRNAAVDGDACLYLYWDGSVKTGQEADGDIRSHLIENTNVIFGNPTQRNPQRQPYIQIVMRDFIEDVIDEAVANGMDEKVARETIKPDSEDRTESERAFDKLVTKVITFFKKDGTVHAVISTHDAIIREEWDTLLTLYPVAWFNWQHSRNSYHGVSIVTEMVPTQIYINKMVANYLRCTAYYAWPKIIYNQAVFPNGWDNRIGMNIAVNGNPNDAYAAIFPGAGATYDVTNALDWIMARLKEASGANDAALGQINSDNTSAIIAAQEANTIPLDLIQRSFYGFEEQIVRIILDMLRAYAGTRYVGLSDEEKATQSQIEAALPETVSYADPLMEGMGDEMNINPQNLPNELTSPVVDSADMIGTPMDIANAPEGTKPIDFSRLGELAWNLDVSIGAGAFFSEALRNTTISNLLQMGFMSQLQYYERVSDKFVPNKQQIIDELKSSQEMAPYPQDPNAAPYPQDYGAIEPNIGDPTIEDSISETHAKNYIQGMRPSI